MRDMQAMDNGYVVELPHPEEVDDMTAKLDAKLEKIDIRVDDMTAKLDAKLEKIDIRTWRIEQSCDDAHKLTVTTYQNVDLLHNDIYRLHENIDTLYSKIDTLHSKIDAFINMNGRSEGREPSKYTVKSDQPPHSTLSDKPDEIYQFGVYGNDKKAFSLSVVHKITGERVKFYVNPKSNLPTWKIPSEFDSHAFFSAHLLHFTGPPQFSVQVQWRKVVYSGYKESKKFATGNDSIDFEFDLNLDKPTITLFRDSIMINSWQIDFEL